MLGIMVFTFWEGIHYITSNSSYKILSVNGVRINITSMKFIMSKERRVSVSYSVHVLQ